MNRPSRIAAVSLGLGLAFGSSAHAAEPSRATLEVTTAEAGEASDILQRRIQERGAVILRDAGVLPAESPGDPVIAVTVQTASSDDPGYAFTVVVTDDGTLIEEHRDTCELCTETELVQRIEARLVTTATSLHSAEPEPAAAASEPVVATPKTVHEDPPPPQRIDADQPRLSAMGKAGIAVLGVGVASTAVGIGLLVRPPSVLNDARYVRDTRPVGGALLGVGLVSAAAGGVLLGLDLRRRRKVSSLSAWFDDHGGGVVIGGRM